MLEKIKQALAQSERNLTLKLSNGEGRPSLPAKASTAALKPASDAHVYQYLRRFSMELDQTVVLPQDRAAVRRYLREAADGPATLPYGAAVFNDMSGLIRHLAIDDPHEQMLIEESGWTLAEAAAWYLWALDQGWLQEIPSYLVQMARKGKTGPDPYHQLAILPHLLWQLYALYWGLPAELRPDEKAFGSFPYFDLWSDLYARRPAADLPLEIGAPVITLQQILGPAPQILAPEILEPAVPLAPDPPPESHAPTFRDYALWHSVQTQLRKRDKPAIIQLLDQIDLISRADTEFTFRVPDETARRTLQAQLVPDMIQALTRLAGKPCTVVLKLPERPIDATPWELPRFDDAHAWRRTLDELALQMTKATFNSWLKDATLVSVHENRFRIGVRNQYAKEWVEQRLRPMIVSTLSAVVGRPVSIEFAIVESDPSE